MSEVLSDNAATIVEKRYLAKEEGEKTVDQMWDRVSGGNKDYRDMMADLLFLPNSPTMFNMGTKSGGTLSACFVFNISDSLNGDWPPGGFKETDPDSILGTAFKASCVAKAGGGVGYYFGHIRPEGAVVKSVHRKACGPVAVLKYMHGLRSLITQGGKRDLAQMGVLNADHPDIRKFINCKNFDPKAIESFNISVSWKDKMLKTIDWDHVERDRCVGESVEGLWYEQCNAAWHTGDPGMLFWDTINRFNATPHLGNIEATNPCGETPNLNDEPCNLGSLALRRFLITVGNKYRIAWDKLIHYAKTATRFLDDILDWNTFPHPNITAAAMATRKLGLGVMGWADMLALLRIPYDTQDAVDLGKQVMQVIAQASLEESIHLGKVKGLYPAYETASKETKAKFPAARNSTRTSVAPTGTIAIIADCMSSIEPYFALKWERTTNEGIKMQERIPVWKDLGDFKPKIASEIHWSWHVKHQAAFQAHTDLGVSKTINMPNDATVKDVSDAYKMMWETGCKGGTVYRDGCRSEQVLVSKDKKSVYSTGANLPTNPSRRKLPDERPGCTRKFKIGGTKGYVTASTYEDGTLGELFIRVSKQGSTLQGVLDAWVMSFSNALQHGMPLEDLIRLHKGSFFEPNGLTGFKEIPACTSIVDFVVRWLELRFVSPGPDVNGDVTIDKDTVEKSLTKVRTEFSYQARVDAVNSTGQMCPECGAELLRAGSCLTCVKGCGFSKC